MMGLGQGSAFGFLEVEVTPVHMIKPQAGPGTKTFITLYKYTFFTFYAGTMFVIEINQYQKERYYWSQRTDRHTGQFNGDEKQAALLRAHFQNDYLHFPIKNKGSFNFVPSLCFPHSPIPQF